MKRTTTVAKIILVSLIIFMTMPLVSAQTAAPIEWKETSVDLGKTPINKPVTVEFSFKNPGMMPLIITDVKPSCGCTVADYPKKPIGSGQEGKITVTYDAKISGFYSKTISVYSNSEDKVTELYIKGEIVYDK